MDVVLSLRARRGLTVVAHYSRMNIDETLVCTVVSYYLLLLHYHWECSGGVDEQRRGVCDRSRERG